MNGRSPAARGPSHERFNSAIREIKDRLRNMAQSITEIKTRLAALEAAAGLSTPVDSDQEKEN